MPRYAAGLADAARTRADYEIEWADPNRLDQCCDQRRIVGAIAVHEHHYVGVFRRHRGREAGTSIAAARLNDVGARIPGPSHGRIGAAAVCHDNAGDDASRDGAQNVADGSFLVEGRYRERDDARASGGGGAIGSCLHHPRHKLHRRPQLAHAAGGTIGKKCLTERSVGRAAPDFAQ